MQRHYLTKFRQDWVTPIPIKFTALQKDGSVFGPGVFFLWHSLHRKDYLHQKCLDSSVDDTSLRLSLSKCAYLTQITYSYDTRLTSSQLR